MTSRDAPDHFSPWLRNSLLLGAFVALVIAAIFTVVLPELADDPADAEDGAPATPAAATPATAPTAPAPAPRATQNTLDIGHLWPDSAYQ